MAMFPQNDSAKYDKIADELWSFATSNLPPVGQVKYGDMLAGWSIVSLIQRVPVSERAGTLAAIKERFGPLRGHAQPAGPQPRWSLMDKLAMRMNWQEADARNAFAHFALVQLNDAVYLWVVTKDKHEQITLEESAAIFPSDGVIAKLRLISA